MGLSLKTLAFSSTLLVLGGSAGFWGSRYVDLHFSPQPNTISVAVPPTTSGGQTPSVGGLAVASDRNFIATAVQQVGPAVVRINATRKVANQLPEAFDNPLFRRFFGGQKPIPDERIERGTGSGFILSPDGRLLTNAHVVSEARTVQVTLKDGRTFEGKVVGVDPVTDVAVVKINARNLPRVKLGNSKNLIPGQWAIAIGNPLGLDNTVTIGIISATDRTSAQVGVPDKRVTFIQTDAAINPGNSGGPLLNTEGEIVGVNTAIRTDAQGLGFAIPIETAARVANQLFSKGRISHPFLGIQMIDLTPASKTEIAQETDLKIEIDSGVLIVRAIAKSPAAQAGLRAGDVIQKINGKTVAKSLQVQEQVESTTLGTTLTLEVNRQGAIQTFHVKPGAYPADELS
ncbi:serine protease [Chroococcidiopsis sp. CCALA 051]|uniref:HhoA/HhoB/HtrA family serine endopeptidase n=1 Tax=Chroococcidiopsis sp. CCALA 051 TaxID=869949 RepID=UPI000D0D047F|nr:HhoA/HhoB/HtrA family serine endopeptidase [Chroococcidiopsis sp. CCALA 051]PSM46899.1 serine protease [Chroococcidiopsis sp. CCALA 051]